MIRPPPGDSLVWLVVAWLATWRLTALVCYERGPFEVLTRLRRLLAGWGAAGLVTCFHCLAVGMSLLVTGAIYRIRWPTLPLALAVAGAVSITERWLGGGAPVTDEDAHG